MHVLQKEWTNHQKIKKIKQQQKIKENQSNNNKEAQHIAFIFNLFSCVFFLELP